MMIIGWGLAFYEVVWVMRCMDQVSEKLSLPTRQKGHWKSSGRSSCLVPESDFDVRMVLFIVIFPAANVAYIFLHKIIETEMNIDV